VYCIYRITNLINGKTYVGQHRYEETPYDDYMGSGIALHKAYKKYGIENFRKEIICKNVQYKATIDDMEKFYIKKEREQNPFGCYNIADGGQGGGYKGKHHSDEARRKMSESHKGYSMPEETRKKISETTKGRSRNHPSEDSKRKNSESHKGMKQSEDTVRKRIEALKGKKYDMHKTHWKLDGNGKRVWY